VCKHEYYLFCPLYEVNCLPFSFIYVTVILLFQFEFPLREEQARPCSQVLDMLDAKIRKICPERGLTLENRNHLKRRLISMLTI